MPVIDLARCDDFTLGETSVKPSTRELVHNGVSHSIEPKVMQVLVALGQTEGRVVSRDELVAQCWGGRIVGDDAINRIIAKLRRIAAGNGAFHIDTVARVGYRLALTQRAASRAEPAERRDGHRSGPFWQMAGAIAILCAIAGWTMRPGPWFQPVARPGTRAAPPAAGPAMAAAVSDLETRGLSAMFENSAAQTGEAITYLQQATALAPRSASAWGSLAMAYVLSLGWAAPGERAAVALRVRDAAAHALAIDPRASRSAAALISLEPTFAQWQKKGEALRVAQRQAYAGPGPLLYQQVQFLMAVGRMRQALPLVDQLAKFSPLVPWIQAARVDLLAAAGRLDDADRVSRQAMTIWPRDRLTWFTAFDLAAFNGQPERALAMASSRESWPKETPPDEILRAQRLVRAMVSRDPRQADRVIAALRERAHASQADAERGMRAAAALGRPADALEFALQLYSVSIPAAPRRVMLQHVGLDSDGERPTAALFIPPAQVLWQQPAFPALVSRIGLRDYWRRAGRPDLCLTPSGGAMCRRAGLEG